MEITTKYINKSAHDCFCPPSFLTEICHGGLGLIRILSTLQEES